MLELLGSNRNAKGSLENDRDRHVVDPKLSKPYNWGGLGLCNVFHLYVNTLLILV